MYNILYTPKAENNIEEIFKYIEKDNIFYAAKTISSIKNTIDILKLFPMSGKNIDGNVQMIVESTYKHKIVYEINGNTIFVLSVFKYKNLWE